MKFGTGSNNELTQKYEKVKVQNDIRTSKQTSPIFNCVTSVSVSLATLARLIYIYIANSLESQLRWLRSLR